MDKYTLKTIPVLLILILVSFNAVATDTDDVAWPREIDIPEGVLVIYQPQPEKLEGDHLFARAAVALEIKGNSEPVFGAIWFNTRLKGDWGQV